MNEAIGNQQTFLQIRTASNLTVEAIASVAGVPMEDIYYLEAGVPYPQAVIDRVLAALSRLTGATWTMGNVLGIYAVIQ